MTFSRSRLPALIALAAGLGWAASAQAATFTVTTGADAGTGSLRQAIVDATAGDTIVVPAGTHVAVTSGELLVNKQLTIMGGGARTTSVVSKGSSRVFHLTAVGTISGLTISG